MLCGAEVNPIGDDALGYGIAWDIAKQAGNHPVRLREGYKMIIKIQDDLSSAATSFQAVVSGLLVPEPRGIN